MRDAFFFTRRSLCSFLRCETASEFYLKETEVKSSLLVFALIAGTFLFSAVIAQAGQTMTTDSGLKVEMLQEGTGPKAKPGQTVTVHYVGTLENGTKFDSSRDRGEPFSFKLGAGNVIKGWDEGIALLNVGSKAKLTIPAQLGYGARGAGNVIPPNATLVFEVELLGAK